MKDNRNMPKALSALTLLVIGSASAGAVMASEAPVASSVLDQATAIVSLDDLAMAEFQANARANNLEALATGHHDDSIGSHHHHDIAKEPELNVEATRFNV
ncbi:hypothetical protein [Stenotrophomonas maltophilia]|uniref:hypothetical protein n=1 Tax=Stenotrophomonas maltophilia TaxID=40324 RepID=UPI000C267E37|nr:hypothetical protein [Stenotrophomonas maltophilia]PJL59233.1 hypothetical protein B9Y82_11070 [Stenotrophomonas maltophilia]